MKFKQWLEGSTGSMGAFGNEEDPEERGLKRMSFLSRPVPDSKKAAKVFGFKKPRMRPAPSEKLPAGQHRYNLTVQ